MTSIQIRREQVLAEAVVSAYINELAASSSRERPSRRPAPERDRTVARVVGLRRARERSRQRRSLAMA